MTNYLKSLCRIETVVQEEKTSKWQSGGGIKLDLTLEYTELDPIDVDNITAEEDKPIGQIEGGRILFHNCM